MFSENWFNLILKFFSPFLFKFKKLIKFRSIHDFFGCDVIRKRTNERNPVCFIEETTRKLNWKKIRRPYFYQKNLCGPHFHELATFPLLRLIKVGFWKSFITNDTFGSTNFNLLVALGFDYLPTQKPQITRENCRY